MKKLMISMMMIAAAGAFADSYNVTVTTDSTVLVPAYTTGVTNTWTNGIHFL